MKYWKIVSTAALSLLITVGCSSNATGSKDTSNTSNEKMTLTILTHWDADTAKAFQPYIDEYQKYHPNIKINLQTVPFGDLLKKIGVSEMSNNGPDIYHIYSLWLPDMVKNGAVAPVADSAAQDIAKAYLPNVVDSVSVKSKPYGYPTEIDDYALVYNKALFKEAGIASPPKSWDELLTDAKKLTKLDSNGRIVQQGFGTISGWDSGVVHPWLAQYWSNGGQFIKDDFSKADLESPQAKETLNFYKTLIDQKVMNPEMSASNDSTTGGYQSNFQLGRTGMLVMADWWEGGLKATMKDKFADVGTAPIPIGPSGTTSTSVFYSWMYTVNAKSAHQKAAWEFLQWLNSPKSDSQSSRMGDWLMNQGIIPSRTSDQQAHQKELDDPFMKTYVEALKTAKPFPIVLGGAEITTDLQKQIESVEFGKSSVDQALKQATDQINAILKDNYGK